MSHTSPATTALRTALNGIPAEATTTRTAFDDPKVVAVFVDRYHPKTAPKLLGAHLLYSGQDAPAPEAHVTVGLFDGKDLVEALDHFEMEEAVTNPEDFSEHTEVLKAYIRDQVIPLGWKEMTDAELDARLVVTPVPAQAFIVATLDVLEQEVSK